MKKITLMLVAFFAISVSLYAQPGGFTRRTVEERVASVHAKLDSAFKLDAAKIALADSAFAGYYRAQDAKREEMMAGGGMPDRDAMMAEMKKLSDARDEKLKGILTEDQYKIWKEQIEPGMRPQRQNRGNR
jgi:periplasmic protein CpxP/Spy